MTEVLKSGSPQSFDASNISMETLANELVLNNLGDFEPLNIKIDIASYDKEIERFKDDWVDYLPRSDRPNNRKSLTLLNLPGETHTSIPSLAEASWKAGRRLSELEFNAKTDLYNQCPSLHGILNEFDDLGRTFIVRSDIGGYFVPHRDHPTMPRECFRLVCFLKNCAPMQYDWIHGVDKKMPIEEGRVYYVNTRQTHRTISWVNDSHHLIMNVAMTNKNVSWVIGHLQHTH